MIDTSITRRSQCVQCVSGEFSSASSAFRFLGVACTAGQCSTRAAPVWALKQTLFTWNLQHLRGSGQAQSILNFHIISAGLFVLGPPLTVDLFWWSPSTSELSFRTPSTSINPKQTMDTSLICRPPSTLMTSWDRRPPNTEATWIKGSTKKWPKA